MTGITALLLFATWTLVLMFTYVGYRVALVLAMKKPANSWGRDDKVDAFYDSIFRNLVSHMVENPSTISSAAQLLFVARNLERVGDHATNVAEMVHFAALGTMPPER